LLPVELPNLSLLNQQSQFVSNSQSQHFSKSVKHSRPNAQIQSSFTPQIQSNPTSQSHLGVAPQNLSCPIPHKFSGSIPQVSSHPNPQNFSDSISPISHNGSLSCFPSKCAFCSSHRAHFICDTCRSLGGGDYSFAEFLLLQKDSNSEVRVIKNMNLPVGTRNVTSENQKSILKKYFQKQPLPSWDDVKSLQLSLSWSCSRIMKWFQNRRTYLAERKKQKAKRSHGRTSNSIVSFPVRKKQRNNIVSFPVHKKKRITCAEDKAVLENFFLRHEATTLSACDVQHLQKVLSKGWSKSRIVQWISNRRKRKYVCRYTFQHRKQCL